MVLDKHTVAMSQLNPVYNAAGRQGMKSDVLHGCQTTWLSEGQPVESLINILLCGHVAVTRGILHIRYSQPVMRSWAVQSQSFIDNKFGTTGHSARIKIAVGYQ